MVHGSNLAQTNQSRIQVNCRLPESMWKRMQHLMTELRMKGKGNQLLVEGLEIRLRQMERKLGRDAA